MFAVLVLAVKLCSVSANM